MAIGADIIIRIAADASRAADDIDQAAHRFGRFGATMESLAGPATAAVGALALFGKQAMDSASATQQAMGAVDSVFGESAATVKAWAEGAATAVGLSESAYGQLASVAGASLKSMGMSTAEAADQTGKMITLGADLAATFGGTTAEAVEALTAALRGEADPAERLGLKLNQATVSARMAAEGTDKLTGAAYDSAKAATIMALATEQAAGANGQFARESGEAAGAGQIAAAQWENAKSVLGEQLLPILTTVTQMFASFAQWVSENSTLVLTLAGILGGLAAAVLAVNAVMAVMSAAQAVATAAQWAWNAALAANPLGLIIIAIAAVIAAIVLLWNKCEWFRDLVLGVWEAIAGAAEACWNFIVDAAKACWEWITGTVRGFAETIAGVWEAIKSGAPWTWLKEQAAAAWGWIVEKANALGESVRQVWEKIKSIGVSCWNAIKSAVDALLSPFRAIKDAVQWLIDKLKQAWDWAVKVISKIPFVGDMIGASSAGVAAPAVYAAPSARTSVGLAGRLSTRGGRPAGAAGPMITVQGALDPVAVAKQIERLLGGQARRSRGVTIGLVG